MLVSLSGSFQTHAGILARPAERRELQRGRRRRRSTRISRCSDLREHSRSSAIDGDAAGDSGRRGHHQPRRGTGRGVALQHPARDRYFRLGAGSRPGRAWPATSTASSTRTASTLPRGIADHCARADRDHAAARSSACWAAWRWPSCWCMLLIVVNFQSWLDPFIIITALPAALAGIVLFLFVDAHHASAFRR